MSARLVPFVAALALVVGAACGGGSGANQPGAKTGKVDGEPSEPAGGDESEGADDSPAAAAARCADGTCSECGSGLCPKGFYCDEQAPGGAACAWLPECAQSASCGCIEKVLGSGCSCREKGGGISVACQGR